MDLKNYTLVHKEEIEIGKDVKTTKKRVISIIFSLVLIAYTIISKIILSQVKIDFNSAGGIPEGVLEGLNRFAEIFTWITVVALNLKILFSILETFIKGSLWKLNHPRFYEAVHVIKSFSSEIMVIYTVINYIVMLMDYFYIHSAALSDMVFLDKVKYFAEHNITQGILMAFTIITAIPTTLFVIIYAFKTRIKADLFILILLIPGANVIAQWITLGHYATHYTKYEMSDKEGFYIRYDYEMKKKSFRKMKALRWFIYILVFVFAFFLMIKLEPLIYTGDEAYIYYILGAYTVTILAGLSSLHRMW